MASAASPSRNGPVAPPPVPASPSATATEDDEPRYPDLQVLFIMSWSYPGAEAKLREMEQVDGPFDRLRRKGWKVGLDPDSNLRIVTADQVRAVVESQGIKGFPAVLSMAEGKVIRSFTSGCTTPLDEHTFEWLRTGIATRPATAPRLPPTVATAGGYPLRGGHWSVDGDWYPSRQQVLHHLRGPNHNHLIPAGWNIESWTYEELRSLHDDLHESGHPRSPGDSAPGTVFTSTGSTNSGSVSQGWSSGNVTSSYPGRQGSYSPSYSYRPSYSGQSGSNQSRYSQGYGTASRSGPSAASSSARGRTSLGAPTHYVP